MALFKITCRFTGAIRFEGEFGSLRLCVEAAVKARASLADANLAGANLADAYLAGAYLAGANLADAYLADANLAGANLARASLAGAYLARANLADAYLAGAYLADANLADAKGIKNVLSIGPIGSRRDYLMALDTDDGLRIKAGCFTGTLAKFEAAVTATHGDNEHAIHYRAAIALIRARFPEQAKAVAA